MKKSTLKYLSQIMFISPEQKEEITKNIPTLTDVQQQSLLKTLEKGYMAQEKVLPVLIQKNPHLFGDIKQATHQKLRKALHTQELAQRTEEGKNLRSLEDELNTIF